MAADSLTAREFQRCKQLLIAYDRFEVNHANPARGTKSSQHHQRAALLAEHAALKDNVTFPHKRIGVHLTIHDVSLPPSTASLAQLRAISLSDLSISIIHKSRALIVRLLSQPKRFSATILVVEDTAGSVDCVSVYEHSNTTTSLQQQPAGSIIAIKEPYYRLTQHGTVVYVMNPTDVMVLPPDAMQLPAAFKLLAGMRTAHTASKYKDNGNAAWKAENYFTALDEYTQGLLHHDVNDIILTSDLYRNRARTNLKLQRYDAAIKDAKDSVLSKLDMPNTQQRNTANVKSYILAGSAEYGARSFLAAQQHFQEALKLAPEHAEATEKFMRASARVVEADTGIYDFVQLTSTLTINNLRLDVADYIKKVEVRSPHVAGAGKSGLIAKDDLKRGQIVMVEKALAILGIGDKDIKRERATVRLPSALSTGRDAQLVRAAYTKLRTDLKLATAFFDIRFPERNERHHPKIVDDQVVFPFHAFDELLDKTDRRASHYFATVHSIDAVKPPKELIIEGVWLRLAHIGNACNGNVRIANVGDVSIVTAVRDIPKGERLTVLKAAASFEDFDVTCKAYKDARIRCECTVCTVERQVSTTHRAQRKARFSGKFPDRHDYTTYETWLTAVLAFVEGVETTYDATLYNGRPRVGLNSLYYRIASIMKAMENSDGEFRYLCKALDVVGVRTSIDDDNAHIDCSQIVFTDTIASIAKDVSRLLAGQGKLLAAQAFKSFAFDIYCARFGQAEGFDEYTYKWEKSVYNDYTDMWKHRF